MATTTAHDLMLASLDAVAVADVDIVPRYFERFLAGRPDEAALFHNRAASHGAMVNEMLTMLLAQAADEGWVPMMMRAQVTTHHDHGDIALDRYRDALDLLVEVLAEAAGPRWRPEFDRVWRGACDRLYALIARHH
ncbi:MAG: globin [Sphingomonadales bacterium]|nr:globin [Sphingomonadales bacterium]